MAWGPRKRRCHRARTHPAFPPGTPWAYRLRISDSTTIYPARPTDLPARSPSAAALALPAARGRRSRAARDGTTDHHRESAAAPAPAVAVRPGFAATAVPKAAAADDVAWHLWHTAGISAPEAIASYPVPAIRQDDV